MQMSCLYASDFPFKNFYKLAQYEETMQCLCYVHLGGLLSTQEARVALGYRLVRLLRFFRA